jgi:hypothetical protein
MVKAEVQMAGEKRPKNPAGKMVENRKFGQNF